LVASVDTPYLQDGEPAIEDQVRSAEVAVASMIRVQGHTIVGPVSRDGEKEVDSALHPEAEVGDQVPVEDGAMELQQAPQ
jgi:hypothetical protein